MYWDFVLGLYGIRIIWNYMGLYWDYIGIHTPLVHIFRVGDMENHRVSQGESSISLAMFNRYVTNYQRIPEANMGAYFSKNHEKVRTESSN